MVYGKSTSSINVKVKIAFQNIMSMEYCIPNCKTTDKKDLDYSCNLALLVLIRFHFFSFVLCSLSINGIIRLNRFNNSYSLPVIF